MLATASQSSNQFDDNERIIFSLKRTIGELWEVHTHSWPPSNWSWDLEQKPANLGTNSYADLCNLPPLLALSCFCACSDVASFSRPQAPSILTSDFYSDIGLPSWYWASTSLLMLYFSDTSGIGHPFWYRTSTLMLHFFPDIIITCWYRTSILTLDFFSDIGLLF